MGNSCWYKVLVQDDQLFDEIPGEKKPLAYLCLPFDGDKAVLRAKFADVGRQAFRDGYRVVSPYLYAVKGKCGPLSEWIARKSARELIANCDEFWVFRDLLTENVLEELCQAVRLGKRVWYLVPEGEVDADE